MQDRAYFLILCAGAGKPPRILRFTQSHSCLKILRMTGAASSAALPRVAVLVDTSTLWGRLVVRGIQEFAHRNGPWLTYIEPRGMEELTRVPAGWRGQGVIARIGRPQMAAELRTLGCPVVNVSGIELPRCRFPRVTTDLKASGRLAAEYFLARGYRHGAYISLSDLPYVSAQQQAFTAALAAAGGSCAVYSVRAHHGAEPDWNLDLGKVGAWLRDLPRPLGLLSWNASCSRDALYAAQMAGLLVPEDVAILSGTDDDLFCEFSHVPLSGIRPPAEQIGHQAALVLHRLMRGGRPPRRPLLLAPLGITTRQSTDTLALADPALVKAVNFIRANAGRRFGIDDVARHAGVSRRLLEGRFASQLRRTPVQEVQRVRLEKAKDLLYRTDLPIPDVAETSGFGSPEYFAYVFKRTQQCSPLRYRRTIRCR